MKLIFSDKIQSIEQLSIFSKKVRDTISVNSIVLLSGNLSAGKTTFVSSFCNYFNIQTVQSPTYALHQRYVSSNVVIDHFDLYRLETEEDIQSSGFYDLLNSPSDFKFIEWPERVLLENFPFHSSLYRIVFKAGTDEMRELSFYEVIRV